MKKWENPKLEQIGISLTEVSVCGNARAIIVPAGGATFTCNVCGWSKFYNAGEKAPTSCQAEGDCNGDVTFVCGCVTCS